MQRQYNWTSAALLAALFIAFSGLAVEAVAAVAFIPNAELHAIVAESSAEPGTLAPAFVTTQEGGLDAIFSQTSFGTNPIDIVFKPTVTVVNPSWLNLNTNALTMAVLNTDVVNSPGINMFFVDTVDHCGGFNVNIVGCGWQPGNNLVVESIYSSGSNGPELLAHEVGHNLGLAHVTPANLMTGTINGNTTLTASQVTAIRGSGLVQSALGSDFIEITPILVVASLVPEPGTLTLLVPGIVFSVSARCRRHYS